MTLRRVAVLDVGGTTLRSAMFDGAAGALGPVTRVPTAGLGIGAADREGGQPARKDVQRSVIEQVLTAAGHQVQAGADAALLAFAGPVTADGTVLAAPTVAGHDWRPINLAELATRRLGVPVRVLNELTAAAWRYHGTERRPFCLITVSSGIGNKVLWGDRVLIDPDGYGGEIGHWQVDPGPQALPCECGGRGHLGGIASGRGALSVARDAARRDPRAFAASALARRGRVQDVTTHDLVDAVHAGDTFAMDVVEVGVTALALAITAMFTAVGLRRFLIIGGFAQALGPSYLNMLQRVLAAAGCFGLRRADIYAMVDFGAADDDHSLIGAGRWAIDHPAAFSGRDLSAATAMLTGPQSGTSKQRPTKPQTQHRLTSTKELNR